ncbi:MAG: hypothetical protein ABI366_06035 [Ginsengibacter sp.]
MKELLDPFHGIPGMYVILNLSMVGSLLPELKNTAINFPFLQ